MVSHGEHNLGPLPKGDRQDTLQQLSKMQRALMPFFKPENYFDVRQALIEAKRHDLIGGCEGHIPAEPPKEAIEACRKKANAALRNDHSQSIANPATGESPVPP